MIHTGVHNGLVRHQRHHGHVGAMPSEDAKLYALFIGAVLVPAIVGAIAAGKAGFVLGGLAGTALVYFSSNRPSA